MRTAISTDREGCSNPTARRQDRRQSAKGALDFATRSPEVALGADLYGIDRRGEASLRDLLIVSGADRAYFPLLRDAVASIQALRPDAALGILDVGLAPAEREWL